MSQVSAAGGRQLSFDDARALTDEVKRDTETLWNKLLLLYNGGAHLALGYPSWGAYFEAEFGKSRRRAYELLNAGKVLDVVRHGALAPPESERQARELVPLLGRPDELRQAWREASTDEEPTALKIRDIVGARMGVHYSSETDSWSTPSDLFATLHSEFGFTLDVCANHENAKCPRYFTVDDDGLAQEWNGVCWMNPPYGSEIGSWVRKAWESAQQGATVVCLVPARVDTGWWWDYCRFGEVRFLRGRLRFGGGDTGAPFPSAVVIFERGQPAKVRWWER